jgi:purine-binding chemotaxis protein CheW
MSAVEAGISGRAAELRQIFDRSFIQVQHVESVATEDFLAIHVAGDPYALRLSEVAGLYAERKITPVPTNVAELKGIAAFRGTMVPVYDLAALLRYPPSSTARWIVRAANAPVALAFDAFDRHCRLPCAAVSSESSTRSSDYLGQIIRAGDFVRPLVNLPSLIAAIRSVAGASGPQ